MMADSFFKNGVTGRHVLVWMVAFFGLIIAIDSYLVYKAVSTFSGIETTDAYRKGLQYNQRIADGQRQADRGWFHEIAIDAKAGRINLTMRDQAGGAVDGLHINATVGRPATNAYDREMAFEPLGAGLYGAAADGLDPGTWVATLTVRESSAPDAPPVYQSKVRLWKAP